MSEFNQFMQTPLWKSSYNLSRLLVNLFGEERELVNYLIQDIPSLAAQIIAGNRSDNTPLLEQMEEFCRQVEIKLNDYEAANPETPMFRAWFRLSQLRTEVFTLLYPEVFMEVVLTENGVALAG